MEDKCKKCHKQHAKITCTEIPSNEEVTVQCGTHEFRGLIGTALQHMGFYMEELECARNQLAQAKAENVQLRIQIRTLQQVASNARGWAK